MPLRFVLACLCWLANFCAARSYLFSRIYPATTTYKQSGISQRSAGSFYKFSVFLRFSFFPLAGTCLQLPASLFLVAPTGSCWLLGGSCFPLTPAAFG
jgi:hypothetical protein